jgi:predicted acylesterase/phospholipase RssA
VLGGGGEYFIAWLLGFAHGLSGMGISYDLADLIVGTSAGAIVGTAACRDRTGAESRPRSRGTRGRSGQSVLGLSSIWSNAGGGANCRFHARRLILVFHPAAREELFQPVDVVIAVDHVLLAHQRAEQR